MRKNCWNTKPIRPARIPDTVGSGRPAVATPATRTVPDVGRSSVPAMASSVDLPDPDGPVTATNSPAPMLTETERSATTGGEPGCRLVTSISSRALTVLPRSPPAPPGAPEAGAAGAGPMARAVPGVVALEGSTIDTASPARTGGRFGLSGTVTVRRSVVAWYGCCPGVAACPGATFCAPTRIAEGRKTTWPRAISPVTG